MFAPGDGERSREHAANISRTKLRTLAHACPARGTRTSGTRANHYHYPSTGKTVQKVVVVLQGKHCARATKEVAAVTTYDDDEIILIISEVERLVGSFANGQREAVTTAIRENADGLLALAKRIANKPNVRSPIAVLVTSIERGEHRLAAAEPAVRPTAPRRVEPTILPELTLEQVERNRRLAPLMRRVVALRATDIVTTAIANRPAGEDELDAIERILDELETIPGEPDAIEVTP